MTAPSDVNRPSPPGTTKYKHEEHGDSDSLAEQDVNVDILGEDEALRQTQWKDLFNFLTRKHVPLLALALSLSVVCGLAVPANAFLLGRVFDAFAKHGAGAITGEKLKSEVTKNCTYLLGLAAGNWLLNSFFFTIWILFGETQARSARERVFAALLKRNMTWFDQRKNGVAAMVPRLQTQIRELQLSLSQPLGGICENLATTLLCLGMALYYSWRITLVILCVVPVAVVAVAFLSTRLQPNIDKQVDKLQEALKYAIGAIRSIETVKVFNGQDYEVWKYTNVAREAASYYVRQANLNALQMSLMSFVSFSMFIQGFWYGSTLLDKGQTPGQVLTTFWAALMACQAFMSILPQFLVMEKGRAAGAKLRAVMVHGSKGQEESRPGEGLKPDHCAGDFELKNICFSYPVRPDELALDNVSLFFAAGETTFVIGKSGSGKSTIGQVLCRFYPSKSGSITLDGHALEALDIDWLRRNITLVEQNSVLFDDTIFRNISYGRPDFDRVTLDEVKAAAEFALLKETVNGMPDGWDTLVGANGAALSGGQRQRMALARARLRDTPVLILDESTSALDYVNRTLILEAIRVWRRGRTTIIITHDISQIQQEDYVYILDKGKVVQDGYRKSLERVKSSPFQRFLSIKEEEEEEEVDENGEEKTGMGANSSGFAAGTSSTAAQAGPRPYSLLRRTSSIYSDESSADEDPLQSYLDADVYGAPRFVPSMFMEQRVEPGNRNSTLLPAAVGGNFWRVLPPTAAFSPQIRSDESSPTEQSNNFELLDSKRRCSFYDFDYTFADTRPMSMTKRDYEIGLGVTDADDTERKSRRVSGSEAILLQEKRRRRETLTAAIAGTPGLSSAPVGREKAAVAPRSLLHRLVSRLPLIGGGEQKRKEHDGSLLTFKQIFSDVWPRITWAQRLVLVVGVAMCVVHAISTPVFAYIFNKLLTTFYLRGPDRSRRALVYSLAILGIAVVDATANYLSHLSLEYAGQMWVHSARARAFQSVLAQPRSFFDEPGNGVESLVEALDYCAEEMRNLVGRFAGAVLMAVLMMGTAVVWSLASAWKLSLVGLGVAPLFYAITVAFNRVSGRQEHLLNQADAAATDVLSEALVNVKTVRALTLEPVLRTQYRHATKAVFARGAKRAACCGLFFGLTDSVVFFATALLFYYGAVLVADGEFDTTAVLQTFTELTMSMTNVNAIVGMIPQMGSARDTATRLLRLANLSPSSSHESRGTTRVPAVGDIALHHLDFAYPSRPQHRVLRDVSCVVRAGTCVAVVGPSGSGKSTLAALLLKLYPPHPPLNQDDDKEEEEGRKEASLTLSGRDIRRLHTPTLRSLVAVVGQQPTLFPASVRENILYGLGSHHQQQQQQQPSQSHSSSSHYSPGDDTNDDNHPSPSSPSSADPNDDTTETTTETILHTAARQAGIHDFVASLPQGYDTRVGDGGLGLSGGQAQRVALARALARRPDVLVLDEATSALDVESARVVRETVGGLVAGGRAGAGAGTTGMGKKRMTVVVITHAREMMEIADRVVMLDGGRVVEEGTFAELSGRRGGAFARMLRGGGLEGEGEGEEERGVGPSPEEVERLERKRWERREGRRRSGAAARSSHRRRSSGFW
ncbi:abc transporter [Diplodia corticola]|uniref:Abc transporter n=1 Tax=Diplodia corticola TaxID=236234 RepID=A0A1J9R5S6_9PEZI|nr:abc transporter [Diplodia corticola]OJD36870.1 abc transporter [Diplodia corticola]